MPGTAQLTGKSVPRVWCTTSTFWEAARRELRKGDGVAGCKRAPPLSQVKKISCPAKRFPNPARGGMGAPAFSRAKNRTRLASSAVTSTTLVVTASTCLAFRSGGGCRRIVQGCVGREASDATLTTMTARPDRCDRDSLLQKTSACFISGPAVQGTDRPWRFCLLPDPTLAKAICKSKSIKVSGLNNVLANQILGSSHKLNRAEKNFGLRRRRQAIASGRPLAHVQNGDFLELGAQKLGECPYLCRNVPSRRVNRVDLRRRRRVFGQDRLQPALFQLPKDQPVR